MITIVPSQDVEGVIDVPVCFEASATVVIPQEDERCIDLPATGTNWIFNSTDCTWQKNGGANNSPDAGANVANLILREQQFYIQAGNPYFLTPSAPNRFHVTFHGVTAVDTSEFYGWELFKNCGAQDVDDCDQHNSDDTFENWKAYVWVEGAPVATFDVNYNEKFRVRSDGVNLHWDIYTADPDLGGSGTAGDLQWINSLYILPLPADTAKFQFSLNANYVNNKIGHVRTFKGAFQGTVPITWDNPLGGVMTGSGNSRCIVSSTPGTYQICVDSEFDEPSCVFIEFDELYLNPVGFADGECVFTGEIVELASNGGLFGILTAEDGDGNPIGTVIDALHWLAPHEAVEEVTLTYTIGPYSASVTVRVVAQLEITNVIGDIITGLIPGESFQLETNYDVTEGDAQVVWENITCPNIVSPTGLLTIPSSAIGDCFGALDCVIRAKLINIEGIVCPNLYDTVAGTTNVFQELRVIVDPIFPTPEFGGPRPIKWKPETPDFRVLERVFEGGCDETHIRNMVPTMRWTIDYDGIPYEYKTDCPGISCCDDTYGYINGYGPEFQTAKKLDDFWMLTAGTWGHFTMKDMRTGEVWRKVRFESEMEREHQHWRHIQRRSVALIWRPCCASAPKGGMCQHNTVVRDTYAPTTPANLTAMCVSETRIDITWETSIDNVGIAGYELMVDGLIVSVGNVSFYRHMFLEPESVHTYKVRSYDFAGNRSAWSSEVVESPCATP